MLNRDSLLLLLSFLLLAGCGYAFRASGEPVGIHLENLAIPLFTSTSSEIGFEAEFTRVIRDEFISHARVPLVSEERAEKVIVGRIYDILTDPVTYNARNYTVNGLGVTNQVTSSRNLRVMLDARLVDTKQGKGIWHDGHMMETVSFAVDPDPLVTRYNQRMALETIARRMAKRIYLRTMERF
jgi:hypothetical protein